MATKLIRLQDGVIVEVDANPKESQQVFGGQVIQTIENATLDKIKPIRVFLHNASKRCTKG